MKTIWGFPEELEPAGEAGSVHLFAEQERRVQAEQLRAVRVQKSPWFIIIWEKLTDSIPGPDQVNIWCCYVRTVIFYKTPWTLSPDEKEYLRYAMIDSTLRCDDVIEFEGEQYEVGTGQIVWYEGAWYCREWARRKQIN
jgi:hypothetical protein